MKQKKFATNIDVITKIMKFGTPLKQAFIMDAVVKAAQAVAEAPAPDWPEGFWVNPEAWKAAATEVFKEMKEAGYAK